MTTAPFLLNGYSYSELFSNSGLKRLDQAFLEQLRTMAPEEHLQLLAYRTQTSSLSTVETSEFLIRAAVYLEQFLSDFFQIQDALEVSQALTTTHNPISTFKKYFVLKRAKKEILKVETFPSFHDLHQQLEAALLQSALKSDDHELAVALLGTQYLNQPEQYAPEIEMLVQWCTRALTSLEGKAYTKNWVSFNIPERIDHQQLVTTDSETHHAMNRLQSKTSQLRHRDGFKLTDERMNAREVQDEINYCIYCHDNEGDFCSRGFPVKKGDPAQGFKQNPLGTTLTGCPLEEKISEMHFLKKEGYTIASLAMVMIDNPMCPATGHRICNDCMKACIYQKQDPVNIPQIETRVLTDVLDLPWGVEIYDLLTRWNPLSQTQWVMKPYNGLKILVAGMGPAGFTLAHHLLLEGFAVVGVDGLKVEPLPNHLITEPIHRYQDLVESLDERIMAGFGGVAEYGITVRWDKNFLKLIYLSLLRKPHFQVFGGVRFGGTLTVEDAWMLGFDHFVVAVGAGLPKALRIPGSLAPGMRQANDFLMALQLGNAAKNNSLTNLQIRLPAVVIGGGLTGIDTATEVQAYYITQVEKILNRYEALTEDLGEGYVERHLDTASRSILSEYLQHAKLVREEREQATLEQRTPDFISLLRAWGGVTIAYRRSLQESPAYINNHEEIQKAFEEGIFYIEALEPHAALLDEHGYTHTLVCYKRVKDSNHEWITTQEEINLPARSILVATGTQPNTAYEFEHKGTFNRLNLQYQHYEDIENELSAAHAVQHVKDPDFGPFTSYHHQDKRVSLIGDTHPVFHGNVVKAIASAQRTYPKILKLFNDKLFQLGAEDEYRTFNSRMNHLFNSTVHSQKRLSPSTLALTIKAPIATHHYKPGQFFRLQNLETHAIQIKDAMLQMEPLALQVARCDHEAGLLTFLVHENSAAAKMCATLKSNEPVSLMGPTGVRTKIPSEHETIVIIGNTNSYAFLSSVGLAMHHAGNQVIFVGLLENKEEAYYQAECEQATDAIVWLVKSEEQVECHRPQDVSIHCDDFIPAIFNQINQIRLSEADRIYLIGDTQLLQQFQSARKTTLKTELVKDPKIFAAVYGNMQCMLKGVCAQCLQWQIDPETGERTKAVFTCSWQDQPLELIDIDHINERQQQNRLLNQLSDLWIEYVYRHHPIARV